MHSAIFKFLPLIAYISCCALVVGLSTINIYFGTNINSDRVPTRWSPSGEPTWYASKQIGLWIPFAIAVFVKYLLFYKGLQFLPQIIISD